MSDNWEIYPCDLGGHRAWISFDRGLSQEIAAAVPKTCVRMRVTLREPTPTGMPGAAEFEVLNHIEDTLVPFIDARGGLYAGRVTTLGIRHFICYAEIPEADLRAFGNKLHAELGYEPEWRREHDPEHLAYWEELYPTPDDDSVLQDMKVFGALRENGDPGKHARRVDHWAYFPSMNKAETFSAWVKAQGYTAQPAECSKEQTNPYHVRFHRVETPSLGEFTDANVHLRKRARELGGTYDGWETIIVKDGA